MATAEILDAELTPTKAEVASAHSPLTAVDGSYRAVDADNVVGIEVLVGKDAEGNQAQVGLTYRPADQALDTELTRLAHSTLGERSVAYLTDDPVGVREIIRLILSGDSGADFSNGAPLFSVRGNGLTPEATVADVEIEESNGWTSFGSVVVDGQPHRYEMRIQRVIHGPTADNDALALVREDNATLIRLEVWR
ncbi:CG0192 family protein [Corynebacterium sp.]|uniref:CG0192 family protein n=1 Tax=Corynebacterium sp. TaxID=1720 RepID=UPI002A91D988|nr:hypothetical protein [Corynebacterium sp.]MDY5785717.1 hypothetical protein [Corynebacterium sp.]